MQEENRQQTEDIDRLLAKAEQQWQEKRLTRPFGDNAYETYRQILRLDPDNSAAREGVARIVAYYEEQAQQQR
nr:hypothetical protein [Pseudomonadota bacterium]